MRGTRNWSRTLASPPLKIFKLIKLTNNKQRFRPPPQETLETLGSVVNNSGSTFIDPPYYIYQGWN